MSGWGITGGAFCCCACLRFRNSADRPLAGVDAWRMRAGFWSRKRVCGRRRVVPRGNRKRGIDWRDWTDAIVLRFDDGGAAQMRESDGWKRRSWR